ncbi:poly-ribose polymerase-like protein [Podospora didyma]|uniref:Poly [ADP-ribose] polymerase n=1 Tax=Podospora didyma TaxID=330526 RepID=A0AAE0K6V1_9PEZI|nr:poly-ribose polymerase-like protein [Podospora didyma]
MPPKKGKKAAAAPAKPALDGCIIALSGQFPNATHGLLKTRVEGLGATVATTVADDTTHLIASEADYNKGSVKVTKAQALGIPIVSIGWLLLCEQKNTKEPEKDFLHGDAQPPSAHPTAASQSNGTVLSTGRRKRGEPPVAADDAAAADDDVQLPKAKKSRAGKAAAPKVDDDTAADDADLDNAKQVKPGPKKARGGKGKAAAADDVEIIDASGVDDAQDATVEPKKSKEVPAMGHGQVAKNKDIQIPLDEGCPFATSVVYIDDDGVIYDAALNQTNATANNNKFYRIQLLVDSTGVYRTWTRWGRVGERGATAVAGQGSLQDAMKHFEKKFKDKSGLSWSQRGENPKPGKYAFVERNYTVESDDEEEDDSEEAEDTKGKQKENWVPPKSTLQPAVQDLMQLIFNQQFFNATMSAMNYDANKLPLGKLSKATITRGFEALKKLAELFDDHTLAASTYGVPYAKVVENLSNSFYSVIPHAFGRNRPPVIQNEVLLKSEIELLETLSDMKDAALIMKMDKVGSDDVHPIDKQYQGLGMEEMTPLDPSTAEYINLQEYLINTRGATHGYNYKIEAIFRIERKGEMERFDKSPYGSLGQNRRLLWHGSRSTNFGGILSQGLRIAPPEAPVSGYMFGKGIYLADMSSKSAGYCCHHMSNNTALLLLCEAELGDPMQELVYASYNAGDDAKKKGMHSTWGQGRTGPIQWKDAKCVHPSLEGIKMPDTTVLPGDTKVPDAGLYYNEYIAYDVAQVRLRYLFRVKM